MRRITKPARVKTIVSLISVAAALCFATGIATAGERAQDFEFTLPYHAYWNSIPLRAGHYTFMLDRTGLGTWVLLRREGRAVAILLASQGWSDEAPSGSGTLTLTQGGGRYFVTALSVPGEDLTLYYHAPKAAEEHKPKVREAMQSVPIVPAR